MTTTDPLMVLIAVTATAFAQVLLKKSSYYDIRTTAWLMFMGVSAVSYAASFILYSRILKYYPLRRGSSIFGDSDMLPPSG